MSTRKKKKIWKSIRPLAQLEYLLNSAVTKYDSAFFGLPLPKKAFNVIIHLRREELSDGTIKKVFETEAEARKEDKFRRNRLRANGGTMAGYLAELLERSDKQKAPYATMASSRWCRELRIRILGELLRCLAPYKDEEIYFVTLINKKWKISAGEFHKHTACKIMESFRQHLNRSGTTKAKGILFAWLHGEYDPVSRCFRLHVHAIVQGDKIEALRTLKGRWGYVTVDGDIKCPSGDFARGVNRLAGATT